MCKNDVDGFFAMNRYLSFVAFVIFLETEDQIGCSLLISEMKYQHQAVVLVVLSILWCSFFKNHTCFLKSQLEKMGKNCAMSPLQTVIFLNTVFYIIKADLS